MAKRIVRGMKEWRKDIDTMAFKRKGRETEREIMPTDFKSIHLLKLKSSSIYKINTITLCRISMEVVINRKGIGMINIRLRSIINKEISKIF